jgi:adenylate cyclase
VLAILGPQKLKSRPRSMEARQLATTTRLVLTVAGRPRVVVLGDGDAFHVGRDPGSDLVLERSFASRHHARILCRRQSLLIVDESSNGTFVKLEDETVVYVHRRSKRLWGKGWLSFGEPLTSASAIRFELPE